MKVIVRDFEKIREDEEWQIKLLFGLLIKGLGRLLRLSFQECKSRSCHPLFRSGWSQAVSPIMVASDPAMRLT